MRARLALLVVPLLLAALLPAAAIAASPSGPPTLPDAAAKHRADVLAYWTPHRIAAAIPRDLAVNGMRGVVPAKKPVPTPTPTPVPTPTPTPTSGPSVATLGSSWTWGGTMLNATGVVLFTMGSTDYRCSGSVVKDGSSVRSIVVTAGHCVVENDGVFATNWMFIPAFDLHPYLRSCPETEFGCWVADALYAAQEFAFAGSFNTTAVQHDWGFAVVGDGGLSGGQLDAKAGSLGIEYSVSYLGQTLSAFGYPAASPYDGSDLVYSRGTVSQDRLTRNTTWSLPSNLTGGASGGPWVTGDPGTYDAAGATVGSVNSYKYTNDKNHMYGPKFNSETKAAFDSANTGTLQAGVVTNP
jgi:hypothetical protein